MVTDSNAQLPSELVDRFGVDVVPLTVTIDGDDLLEGVDIGADDFWARYRHGETTVSTSQPSPGRFAEVYSALVARGCDEILSIHIGSALSGTINSARLGAEGSSVPVRIVDTGTASFAIACCVWEAAEALAKGATVEEAAQVAEAIGASVGNVFVVSALDLARAGGRLAAGADQAAGDGIPVLSLVAGAMQPLGKARDVDEAADLMADHVRAGGSGLRVGIGIADAAAAPLWQALEDRLASADEVLDLVRYRIGPSVGAHTGPGTAGAVFYPSV